ncbi:hypothetical protein MTO96_020579 [Rhipicephalus appendiculatus]
MTAGRPLPEQAPAACVAAACRVFLGRGPPARVASARAASGRQAAGAAGFYNSVATPPKGLGSTPMGQERRKFVSRLRPVFSLRRPSNTKARGQERALSARNAGK